MRHNGAEIVIKLLEREGVEIVSGIPGGANLPLYNALHGSPIRHVLARHEQGAGFIAHGMARSTGRTAVCFATSGPGATNLVTALADAKLDSIPIVAFTGQVATTMIGTDAFQEVDTYGMTLPITKHNFLVKSARELLTIVPRAFEIAGSGRPGPVVVDLPKDVQLEEVDVAKWPSPSSTTGRGDPDARSIRKAAEFVNKSKRPVIYAGGGITASGRQDLLIELARKNSIPVALTLMALGCFPPEDPLYLGMLGMHGAVSTNLVLDKADLILVLGARFDDRAVGRIKDFCPAARVIHVDVDAAEIHKIRHADLPIVGDAGRAMEEMLPLVAADTRTDWMRRITAFRSTFPLDLTQRRGGHPIDVIKTASSMVPRDTIVCTDVGQHQMWVAQAYPFTRPRTLLTSGGLGTMGFGLPAAIGAALAHPGRRVLCFSGDGSLQMNIQELATLGELNLPVTIVVLNNGHLGLVRQQQEMFYERNFIASKFEVDLDFAAIGRQFGVPGYRVELGQPYSPALAAAFAEAGPSVVDVSIHHLENVLPMVPPGRANRDMIGMDGLQVNLVTD